MTVKVDPLRVIAEAIKAADGKPITSGKLSDMLQVDRSDHGNPTVRRMVRQAIERFGVPIGANSKGYFLIKSRHELDEYNANLDSRMRGILGRKLAVNKAFHAEPVGPLFEAQP